MTVSQERSSNPGLLETEPRDRYLNNQKACDRGLLSRKDASNFDNNSDSLDKVSGMGESRLQELEPSNCTERDKLTNKNSSSAQWKVVGFHRLPDWLQDNEFLFHGHRAPTNSFEECFKSICCIHTETGNIWTHLLGMAVFMGLALHFWIQPPSHIRWQDKIVFSVYFVGIILCMAFSWMYHTLDCHSRRVGKLFLKMDYCGIAFNIIGNYAPWLYYTFYCHSAVRAIYISLVVVLGLTSIVVSMRDTFSQPKYRALRAGVFASFGLSGVVPALHFIYIEGLYSAFHNAAFGWLLLMAAMYLAGVGFFVARVPERIFPGKFDIWFHSHQIFHVFAMTAALATFQGLSVIAHYRLTAGGCQN